MCKLINKSSFRLASNLGLILVLLITGCNLPGKSESPTQQSAEPTNTASPIPSPTPAEPVQARSLDQALYDGVENGTWTVEESILTGLRFLAGEVSSDEAFGDTPLMSTEGTGVIYSAQRYIYEGAEEEAKVEMQRYLDMLMPSPEILDQISRPIAQADSMSHLARVVNRPDSDQIVCQDMWARSFTNIAPIDCLLLIERTIRSTNIRLYYPEYWGEDDPRLDSMEVIMDAAEKSVEQYNGYGPEPINTVYMVFTDLAFFDTNDSRFDPEVFAAAYNFDPADSSRPTTCRIGIFPYGIEGSSESLQQTIAHEMFHCYQYKNLQPETLVVHRAFNLWWVEGTAEFYGATVYPTNNDEFIFNDDFQANVPGATLFEMSYENYLFFQFLAREGGYGLNGVVDILRTMPTSGEFRKPAGRIGGCGRNR